jgi:Protein of unknown function (DUF3293)
MIARSMKREDMSLAKFIALLGYLFQAEGIEYEVRIDQRNPIAEAFLRQRNAAAGIFMTAMNPRSRIRTVAENAAATDRLEAELRRRGHDFLPHVGKAIEAAWPHERGLFILDMPEGEAAELAELFDQNAIVAVSADRPARLVLTRIMLREFGLAPAEADQRGAALAG